MLEVIGRALSKSFFKSLNSGLPSKRSRTSLSRVTPASLRTVIGHVIECWYFAPQSLQEIWKPNIYFDSRKFFSSFEVRSQLDLRSKHLAPALRGDCTDAVSWMFSISTGPSRFGMTFIKTVSGCSRNDKLSSVAQTSCFVVEDSNSCSV